MMGVSNRGSAREGRSRSVDENVEGSKKSGFRWDDETWGRMFDVLMKRYHDTGSWIVLRVKDDDTSKNHHRQGHEATIHPDNSLYHWMATQRKMYRNGRLEKNTPERYRKLKDAGFPFVISNEEKQRRRTLAIYGAEAKPLDEFPATAARDTTTRRVDCDCDDSKSLPGLSPEEALSMTVTQASKSSTSSFISSTSHRGEEKVALNDKQKYQALARAAAETVSKLTSKFEYGQLMVKWLEMWSRLLSHVEREGRWIVFKVEDQSLYHWMHDQRKLYRKNVLQTKTPQRYQLMKDAGFPFEPSKDKQFQTKHKPLKKIPPGFSKVPTADEWWEHQYGKLKEYYKLYQTNIVSAKNEKELHGWTHTQIKSYRNGKLSEEREHKLREIGCPLDKWFYASNTPDTNKKEKGPSKRLQSPFVHKKNEVNFNRIVEQLSKWYNLYGTWDVKKRDNPLLYRYVLKFTARSTHARTVKAWRTPGRIEKLRKIGFPIDNYLSSSDSEGDEEKDDHRMVDHHDEGREQEKSDYNEDDFDENKKYEATTSAQAEWWEDAEEWDDKECVKKRGQETKKIIIRKRKRARVSDNESDVTFEIEDAVSEYDGEDNQEKYSLSIDATSETRAFLQALERAQAHQKEG